MSEPRRDQQDIPLRIYEQDGWWYVNRLRGTGIRFKSKEEAEAYINRPGCGNPNCGHGRAVQPPVIPSGDCFPAPVNFARKYQQLTIGEKGELGSQDATSAGPPVEHICLQIDRYTATNLLILRDAIHDELDRRLAERNV